VEALDSPPLGELGLELQTDLLCPCFTGFFSYPGPLVVLMSSPLLSCVWSVFIIQTLTQSLMRKRLLLRFVSNQLSS
jgi:hypothetical protein